MQTNGLGVFGSSESELVALALKYELVMGRSLKWRKSPLAIAEMVKGGLASGDAELKQKANAFVGSLSNAAKAALADTGVDCTPPVPATTTRTRTYRGAVIVEEVPVAAKGAEAPAKKRMWRGAAY